MRKLLIGVVVVLLLAVVAVAAFLFVPSPLQKWAVERGASMATGRQVTFGEPFRLRAWPPVTITAADIRVANADWGKADELARVDALDARVDLLAFWREQPDQGRPPDGDAAAAQSGGRRGRPAELGFWAAGARRRKQRQPSPRPASRSRVSSSATSGSKVAWSPSTTVPASRTGAPKRSTWRSPRPAPTSRSSSTAGSPWKASGPPWPARVARPQGVAAGEPSPIELDLGLPGGAVSFDGTVNTAAPAANGEHPDRPGGAARAGRLARPAAAASRWRVAVARPQRSARPDRQARRAGGSAAPSGRCERQRPGRGSPGGPHRHRGRAGLGPRGPDAVSAAGGCGRPACFRQAASGGADGGLVRCADRFAAAPAGRRRFPSSRRRREGTAARARRGEHEAAGGPAASHRHHRRVAGLWRAAHRQRAGDSGQPARLCARAAEPGHRPARHAARR